MGTSSSQFSGSVTNGFKRGKQPLPDAATINALRRPWYERLGRGLQIVWYQLTKNKKVAIGLVIVFFFILVAAFGPLFIHTDPGRLSNDAQAAPSAAHWLGTTAVGQDIFSQLVVGTRSSIFWGFITGIAVTLLSITVGLVSGYFGGFIDEILSLLTNVFLVLPALPLAIVLASYFPRGPVTVALVITFTSWSWGARVLRSQTLSMRSREFVTAARANGETTWRIIFFEIFPNEISIVAANFVSTTLYVILASASLEFLGLGDPNGISWGSMFYWAQKANALLSGLWWWFIPPGVCIAVLGAGLSLINFGIDEIADPRLRKEKTPKLVKEKKVAA
ncbi:ABC transporter permease [Dictyobacter formicarum]|uniref:Peptide ABC transporter permease n=1 Tax=Dictyobacter formicarum TaxID=2778368 RepID=A0ABQ3VST3_9CHLR|nr:ABC transporter permease [Dictyobacter formicarum]GHO88791.1 peptide ABC transporter permease [Dictyobacter formicarum]